MGDTERAQTLVDELLRVPLDAPLLRRLGGLYLQALLFGTAGFLVPYSIGLETSGLMSVFLAAGSLQTTMGRLLDENRQRIWASPAAASKINGLTAASVLVIFLGILSAYVTVVALLPKGAFDTHFHAVLQLSGVDLTADISAPERFSGAARWFQHNLSVAFVAFALSFFYRAFGAAIILSWNAATWVACFLFLGRLLLGKSSAAAGVTVTALFTALLPHLLAESLGYCLVAIAAIFASSGLAKYSPRDQRLWQVLRAALVIGTLGTLIVTCAAVVEAYWAPFALSWWRQVV